MASPRDVLKPGDEGYAGKIAGNKEIKEAVERIIKLKGEMADLASDIKGVYDLAADKGIDRKALKAVVKIRTNDVGEEHKQTVNSYLKALGDLPLFAATDIH